MAWIVCWVLVTLIGAAGTVASVNRFRFERRVEREAREMLRASPAVPPVSLEQHSTLPPPVQRYLAKALAGRTTGIGRVRLRHGGLFRPSLKGSWLPIRGEQYFTSDPPGFIWWGRVRMFPGLWVDARDRSAGGAGNMLVRLQSTITLADSSGPELDAGALVRLLGEMVWFPSAFRDARYVAWSAVDNQHATATLRVNDRSVSADFTFGPDDLPIAVSAERYRDVGGRTSVLTPFVGRLEDFRPVDGVLVPHRIVGAWIIDGQTIEYANFEVQQLEFDRAEPY